MKRELESIADLAGGDARMQSGFTEFCEEVLVNVGSLLGEARGKFLEPENSDFAFNFSVQPKGGSQPISDESHDGEPKEVESL